MAARDYKRFTSAVYHGNEIERFMETGEVNGYLLIGLTADITARHVFEMIQQQHPICATTPDEPEAAVDLLMNGNAIRELVISYLAEKEFNPALKFTQSSGMPIYLNQLADDPTLTSLGFDVAALRRTMPSVIESSYEEAKGIITEVVEEHASQPEIK